MEPSPTSAPASEAETTSGHTTASASPRPAAPRPAAARPTTSAALRPTAEAGPLVTATASSRLPPETVEPRAEQGQPATLQSAAGADAATVQGPGLMQENNLATARSLFGRTESRRLASLVLGWRQAPRQIALTSAPPTTTAAAVRQAGINALPLLSVTAAAGAASLPPPAGAPLLSKHCAAMTRAATALAAGVGAARARSATPPAKTALSDASKHSLRLPISSNSIDCLSSGPAPAADNDFDQGDTERPLLRTGKAEVPGC